MFPVFLKGSELAVTQVCSSVGAGSFCSALGCPFFKGSVLWKVGHGPLVEGGV